MYSLLRSFKIIYFVFFVGGHQIVGGGRGVGDSFIFQFPPPVSLHIVTCCSGP